MSVEPTVLEVATIIRSRTRGTQSGMQEGTFNNNTNPNGKQASEEIQKALAEAQSDIGIEEIPESVVTQVRGLIAILAASYIEMSYYSEQVATNKSPYNMLISRYEKRLPRVCKAIERALEGDTADSAVELLPQFEFPDGSNPQGMIGWGSQLG